MFALPADAAQLFFSVNDATNGSNFKKSIDLPCNAPGARELNISGTYTLSNGGQFRIIGSTSTATPQLVCDEAADKLWIENIKIERISGTISNVKISLWKTFTGATNSATYSVSASGNFGGTPSGAWLSVRGYLENASLGGVGNPSNPPSCIAELTKCASSSPGTWAFTSTTFFKSQTVTPPNPRTLTAKFWFKLVTGSTLSFSKLGVKLGAPFGPPDQEECRDKDEPDCTSSRAPISLDELVFVQCLQETDVREECKSEKKNCPACMVKDGSPFDPKNGEKIESGWIKLKKDGGSITNTP